MSVKVSIILPTFNAEKTLQKALESIFQQTYNNYEVVIVDGGSTDTTSEIVQSYVQKDGRFRWASEPDEGIYDAMNKGVQLAKGEWIYFLGSDDYLYAESVLQHVAHHLDPSLKIIHGKVYMGSKNALFGSDLNPVEILYLNICHQSIFYHRSCFKNKVYNKKFRILADYAFNIDIFCQYPQQIKHIDLVIAYYSDSGQSSYVKDGFDDTLPQLRKAKYRIFTPKLKFLYLLYHSQQNLPPSRIRGVLSRLYTIFR